MKNFLILNVLLSLLLFSYQASAQENLKNVGPMVGEKAPLISVIDSKYNSINIHSLSGDKGLIILFFRSADWCPFCKRHLLELNEQAKKFTNLGYGLAAISYDDVDTLSAFTTQKKITYPLLSDQKAKTMKAYNILNTAYEKGDDNYGIPYPGVVVIDQTGRVAYKYFFKGYKNRVKFSHLYQQVAISKE